MTNSKNPKFTSWFGPRRLLKESQPINSILIVPFSDGWNDFGYKSRTQYKVTITKDKSFTTLAFIGFTHGGISTKDPYSAINIFEDRLTSTNSYNFFTMLPSMEAYREFISNLGLELALEALSAVRDIVFLSRFSPNSYSLKEFEESDIFAKSFVRDSESYFAYKNANSLLTGLQHEQLGSLTSELQLRFKLPNYHNEHHLSFKFEQNDILPKRIAVLIGKNGVGKSQSLGRLAKAAITRSNSLTSNEGRVEINRLLAFAPTNEAESVFPSDKLKSSYVWYKRFSLNRSRRSKRSAYLSDLIIQLARSRQSIKRNSRWKIFIGAIEPICRLDQICLATKLSNKFESLVRLNIGKGEEQLLTRYSSIKLLKDPQRVIDGKAFPLSSGEISFIKFAAQVSLNIENGSLLLIDEPETHLHPNFIQQFVILLDKLLEMTGSQAIIATHSVYFVKEVFRDQVTILRASDEGHIQIEKPRLRTFGGDVGAISFFVFGEDAPTSLAKKIEENLIGTNKSWEELYEKYKDELSNEFLMTLRHNKEK